jgi:hypothetical protein
MTELSAPSITTPESIRLGAVDLLKKCVDQMLNAERTSTEEWIALAAEADMTANVLAVEPADCLRCRGKEFKEPEHVEGCPLLNPPAEKQADRIAALELEVAELPEKFRAGVLEVETAKIVAEYTCTCPPKDAPKKAARGASDNSFSGRVRRATDRMSAKVIEVAGKPDVLRIEFASGDVQKWDLPSKGDHPAIKTLTTAAIEWAKDHGAVDGQQAAVRKALNDKNYYTREQTAAK